MKRLLALLVLLALGAIALYHWRSRPARAERAAEGAAAEARQALQAVGDKLRETKHGGAVRASFELNRELAPCPIDIEASDKGVVTLTGRVPSDAVKALAARVAGAVPGVTLVVDGLAVDPSLPPPPAIAPATAAPGPGPAASERVRRAQRALQANASLAGYAIEVREEGGRLVLTGRVRTAAERDLAGLLARDAAGAPVENAVSVGS